MKLSTEQLERLSERVFKVLKASGHLMFDARIDERIEDTVVDTILSVLEDDSKIEDRLSREAERLVHQQEQIAKASGRSLDDLVEQVKLRLARSKKIILGDGPDRSDSLAEKIFKALWLLEGLDFVSEDVKIQNCIARALHRFRHEDERILNAVEKLVSRKTVDEAYTPTWCIAFDRYFQEVRQKLDLNTKHRSEATGV